MAKPLESCVSPTESADQPPAGTNDSDSGTGGTELSTCCCRPFLFWRLLGPKKNGSFWGVWGQKLCGDHKSLFWKGHLELSVREETRSDGHEELWDMSRFWCQKGHFTEGSKTCFTHISFKLTLYKNRYVYKLCASGGTVTRYWAFVDIAKHVPRDFE